MFLTKEVPSTYSCETDGTHDIQEERNILVSKGFSTLPSRFFFNNVTCCLIWFLWYGGWLIRDNSFHIHSFLNHSHGAEMNGNKFTILTTVTIFLLRFWVVYTQIVYIICRWYWLSSRLKHYLLFGKTEANMISFSYFVVCLLL